jgi:cyclase
MLSEKLTFISEDWRSKDWSMNRRDFLVRSSLLATAGFLARSRLSAQTPATRPPAAAATPPPAPSVTEFRPLRRDVGVFTGRGGTIGWLANKDALAVVDTQFPDTASTCLAGLPGRGARTLDVVLNTHHHADHTSGNPIFKPAARTIVAHANVPRLQFAAAERADKDPIASSWARLDQQVYADTTFTNLWRRELGGEIVTAEYHGAAHTSGDATITFEKANVVHMGDLVFNRLYPVIDRPAGASIRHWIVVLEEVVKTFPADAIYLFGHGSKNFGVTGRREELLVLRDYFSAVLDYTQKKIAAGEPKGKIVALENFPGFPDFHTPLPNRLGLNLSVAYDELTEKKA